MVLAEAANEEEIGVGRRKEGGRRCRKEEGLLALLPLCPAAVPPPHLPPSKGSSVAGASDSVAQSGQKSNLPSANCSIALSPLSLPPILHYYYYYTTKGRHSFGHAAKSGRSGKKRGEEGGVVGGRKKRGQPALFPTPSAFQPQYCAEGLKYQPSLILLPPFFPPDRRALQTRISIHQCDYNIKRYTQSPIYVEQILNIIPLMPYYRTLYRETTVQHTIHVQCRYIQYVHSTYVYDSSIKCRKSWEESGERGRLFPPDIPPSFPQLVHEAMFCTQADDLQHNHHPPHPVPCKRKGEGRRGGYLRTFKETGAVGEQLRTAQQQKRIRSPVSTAPFGRSLGRSAHFFLPWEFRSRLPFTPAAAASFAHSEEEGGKGFSASPSPSSSVHGTTHSPPSPFPSFPTGLLHSTRHPSFLFPLLPSFLARRAKKETLSCSSSGGGELPTNPLLPKRAPSPPQQAPRNRTADGV